MSIYSAAHDTQVTGQPNRPTLIDGDDDVHLRKNADCVRILGVAAVFTAEPASILQLSRVLEQKPEDLLTRLRLVSKHLHQPLVDVYSVVAVNAPLKSWIFDNAQSGSLFVDRANYNERVARWCLADTESCDAR
jgi:SpoVK/Ycf46/Vps4 family AAA+-type ATPase